MCADVALALGPGGTPAQCNRCRQVCRLTLETKVPHCPLQVLRDRGLRDTMHPNKESPVARSKQFTLGPKAQGMLHSTHQQSAPQRRGLLGKAHTPRKSVKRALK